MGPDHGEKWYRTRLLFSILFLVCVVRWKWNFIFALETLKNTDRELLRPGPFSGKRVAAVASAQWAETDVWSWTQVLLRARTGLSLTAEPSAQGLGLLKTLLMPKAMETGWVWIVKELYSTFRWENNHRQGSYSLWTSCNYRPTCVEFQWSALGSCWPRRDRVWSGGCFSFMLIDPRQWAATQARSLSCQLWSQEIAAGKKGRAFSIDPS